MKAARDNPTIIFPADVYDQLREIERNIEAAVEDARQALDSGLFMRTMEYLDGVAFDQEDYANLTDLKHTYINTFGAEPWEDNIPVVTAKQRPSIEWKDHTYFLDRNLPK